MLVGIIADLHANLEATLAVFTKLDAIGPDKVISLGDLAGYNANPNEVIDIVRERRIPTVMGNHDAVVCGLDDPWFFNKTARKAAKWHIECIRDDNKRWLSTAHEQLLLDEGFLAVHGSPGNRDDYILDWLDAMRQIQFLDHSGVNVCFFGHSHRSSFFAEKGHAAAVGMSNGYSIGLQNRYLINPGSVGQPRDQDPRAAFGLYDTDVRSFEFHRVEYDVEAAAQKVLQAGLPAELARRLAKGK